MLGERRGLAACLLMLCVTASFAPSAAARLQVDVPAQANATISPFPAGDSGFGTDAVAVGDVNADGFSDVAVEGPHGDEVVLGGRRAAALGASSRRAFTVRGASLEGPAGDVNGDGVGDLLASVSEGDGRTGSTFVIFGRRGVRQPDLETASLGSRGYAIEGRPGDNAEGTAPSAASAGDVNGDGRGDTVVSEIRTTGRGYAAIVYGRSSPETVDLGALSGGGFRIENLCAGYYTFSDAGSDSYSEGPLSAAVSGAGDVNGDRLSDVVIGLGRDDDEVCGARRGQALIIYGKRNPLPVNGAAPGAAALNVTGEPGTGNHVAGALDITGDRRSDVLVSAPGGAAVITDARRSGTLSTRRLGHRGWAITGGDDVDFSPPSLLGDMTGDRRSEIGLGTTVLRSRRKGHARSVARIGRGGYVVRMTDSDAADFAPGAVRPAGDVNGDGLADALVIPTELGPPDVHLLIGRGPPLVEVAPFRTRILVDRRGRARFTLLCPGNAAVPCRGRLRLADRRGTVILRTRFAAAAGAQRKFAVRVPRRILRTLRRGTLVRVGAVASARSTGGRHVITRRSLPLLASRPPR